MPDEVSRTEYEQRHSQLQADIIRAESRVESRLSSIEARLASLEIAIAKNGSNVWKYISASLISFIIGVAPYVLHMAGVIR